MSFIHKVLRSLKVKFSDCSTAAEHRGATRSPLIVVGDHPGRDLQRRRLLLSAVRRGCQR